MGGHRVTVPQKSKEGITLTDHVIEINKDNFKQEVLKSQLPVLLDFWGPRCVPCMRLMPIFEELAAAYIGRIKFCKCNTSENKSLTRQFNIMTIPTLHFYKNGNIIATEHGAVNHEKLEDQLKILLD